MPGRCARRCYFIDPPLDLKQPVLRAAGARVTMTPRELDCFKNWQGTDAELNDWFFGRMLAKDAVRAAWGEKYGESTFPADMETEVVDGRIVCRPRGAAKAEPFPPVRLAIAGGNSRRSPRSRTGSVSLLWQSQRPRPPKPRARRKRGPRAAAADALRLPVEKCSLVSLDANGAAIVETGKERLRVQTARQKDAVVATTLCEPG